MDKDLVADIKARLSVEQVVGAYIDLKQTGASYKALSPFKSEKTPSLIVTPQKQIWYDFSAQIGGDIFKFVQEYEGVDFKQSLEILAKQAGLNLADYNFRANSAHQQAKKTARQICQLAATFYHQQLLQALTNKAPVRNYYLTDRGFNKQVCADFLIGYAPPGWQALSRHLIDNRGVDPQLAQTAGLLKRRSNRWGDMMADRLVVPLTDNQGQPIGFTGRIIKPSDKQPKYINTPQTLLYNKSRHVFGYFQAQKAIHQAGFVVIVEGNFDVLTAHQFGYPMVVAAGGTALGGEHLDIVSRLTDDVRLAFDGDSAGQRATERIIKLALKRRINLSIISLPKGTDPDDLMRAQLDSWQQLFANPTPALDWLVDYYQAPIDLQTVAGQRQLIDKFFTIMAGLTEPIIKKHYLNRLAKTVDLSVDEIKAEFNKFNQNRSQPSPVTTTEAPEERDISDIADNLLISKINPDLYKVREVLFFLAHYPNLIDQLTSQDKTNLDNLLKGDNLRFWQQLQNLNQANASQQLRSIQSKLHLPHKSDQLNLDGTPKDYSLVEAQQEVRRLLGLVNEAQVRKQTLSRLKQAQINDRD